MHVHVRTVKLSEDRTKYQMIGSMHVQPLSKTLDNSEHGHTQPAHLHITKSRGFEIWFGLNRYSLFTSLIESNKCLISESNFDLFSKWVRKRRWPDCCYEP